MGAQLGPITEHETEEVDTRKKRHQNKTGSSRHGDGTQKQKGKQTWRHGEGNRKGTNKPKVINNQTIDIK